MIGVKSFKQATSSRGERDRHKAADEHFEAFLKCTFPGISCFIKHPVAVSWLMAGDKGRALRHRAGGGQVKQAVVGRRVSSA